MTFSEKTILYVEDEIIVAIETAQILSEFGFKDVRLAHNLRSAEFEINSGRIDVALLDVNLGNGERTIDLGIELARLGTAVVFVSGYNKSELSERIQGFDFLEKPIETDDLEALLTSIVLRAHVALRAAE